VTFPTSPADVLDDDVDTGAPRSPPDGLDDVSRLVVDDRVRAQPRASSSFASLDDAQ
jgi:hypothetical protein